MVAAETEVSMSTEAKQKKVETYECDKCGACCEKLIVEIDELDLVREPKLRGVATLMDGCGSIQYDSVWEKEYLLTCAEPCPMLSDDKTCSVYPTRPNACVAMQAGDEQCQIAREAAGLPPLEPVKLTNTNLFSAEH